MREYISSPNKLLKQIWKDMDVHIVQKSHTLGKRKFNLIDISLNGHGQDEDKKYIRSVFYRENIRRGNTIIEDSNQQYCEFARKGTPKILDIKYEHVQYFLKEAQIQKYERNVAQIIFEGVNLAFDEGKKVQLIKTQKLNGENVQVSYNRYFNAWIICSKNVSLLARSVQDLKIYKQNRYHYALLMADQWFQQIKNLTQQQINSLQKLLNGYTAVGQFCGHPDYQHLIKYESIRIRWFAIVDNFSDQYCLDPFKAKRELQKFGFKVARVKSIILTSSPEAFYSNLKKLYLKTASAGLEDAQFGMEGSIVYFVVSQTGKNGIGKQIAVGAGKLKTLQYRFFRKIRQKVSRYITKNQRSTQLISSYKKQIKELQQSNKSRTPFPLEYYIKILKQFIDLIDNTGISDQKLRGNFISLLKMIFYSIYKRISLKNHGKSMIKDQNFMDKVGQIPFSKYNGLGCNTKIIYIVLGLPGMFKTYMAHKISLHFDKIKVPYKIISVKNNQNIQKQINDLYQKQGSSLQHYYLDGSFDCQTIFNLVKYVNQNGNPESYYRFILIKDDAEDFFICEDRNQYPFRLQTILMCYYGQHRHKANSPRLQDKIDNLKIVTQRLRKNANFNDTISKLGLQEYKYPFSQKCKFQNISQMRKIIQNVLKVQDQKSELNSYGILIMRLQKIETIEYLSEQSMDNQIQYLIKASYPSIPIINFKK